MKMVHSSQLTLTVALLVLTASVSLAVEGPQYTGQPAGDDLPVAPAPAPAPAPVKIVPEVKPTPSEPKAETKTAPKVQPKAEPKPQPKVEPEPEPKTGPETVDKIKGIGKFVFGAKVSDFPVTLLQPADPRAKGKLLRVSPYGQNYVVTDLTGLTWGNIPVTGMVVTFADDYLIDIQIALKATKADFYLAERAFKEKYGPNHARTSPVEAWSGDRIQVTLVIYGALPADPGSLDKMALGKLDLFDSAKWAKVEAVENAKVQEVLNKRYQDSANKLKANL